MVFQVGLRLGTLNMPGVFWFVVVGQILTSASNLANVRRRRKGWKAERPWLKIDLVASEEHVCKVFDSSSERGVEAFLFSPP